eukprot:2378357-Prymnesium_polylepis.1
MMGILEASYYTCGSCVRRRAGVTAGCEARPANGLRLMPCAASSDVFFVDATASGRWRGCTGVAASVMRDSERSGQLSCDKLAATPT